ncbi:hypothetical protein [Singulisphaera acidiphila]|uniref:Uncharacterized protein n=1 Tax=Singulisphaera acidiphila (strain ATCC BAA-1392 / DSM 18658 / VKM B-2454 / MOB10) TaxID=886293 RepID=L0DJ99_SINAD|nr:hypothetical protein [Singulisphaera acidiphila]AGA28756.1 hypothetical protein Sinac_4578 [Singulisphaera acidiphila DSM 18658]
MTRLAPRFLFLGLVLWSVPGAKLRADGVPRNECFPVEQLDPKLRPQFEELLLKMLDSEALYTIVGGIKPVSSSFWWTRFSVDSPDLSRLDEMRKIVPVLRCGDAFQAGVLVFAAVHDGKRHAHAWVAYRPALRRTITAHLAFFSTFGISPESHPIEVVEKMEHAPTADRLRASGYLFGYPDHAVDFFVDADLDGSKSTDKKLVPRDFLTVPTVASESHKFVWAVPKGHQPNDEDRAIMTQAEPILAEYRRRRDLYIGAGKPGVVALVRDWFDDGYGRCTPENAQIRSNIQPPSVTSVIDVVRVTPRPPAPLSPAVCAPTPPVFSYPQGGRRLRLTLKQRRWGRRNAIPIEQIHP